MLRSKQEKIMKMNDKELDNFAISFKEKEEANEKEVGGEGGMQEHEISNIE